ncbi:glycosyltransferase [Flavobacterium sp. RSB2_4_14]|uniref:glycosyltransferase n=1 Tax=Flavobacterium sp. RSB2_4_14 TaxID=3447665 RepID=UPI003F38880D
MKLLYQLYFSLPQFKYLGIFGKAFTKINAMILKRLLDFYLPSHYLKTAKTAGWGITEQKRVVPVIVSVTSFPARIEDVWISMESLLRQTVKPDAIILWLASEQFPNQKLPEKLLKLQDRGLTIRYCDDDLRSHKKYYYAMQEFPEACIVTFDDDLYYDEKVMERLLKLYEQHPDCICTNRAHQIKIENGTVLPYRQWIHNAKNILTPTKTLLPTGGAGTLYPPHSLSESAFDTELIRSLCFHADDVWLKLMATLNGKKSVTHSFYNKDFLTVSQTQNEKLVSQNVFDGGNDTQFENTCNHFSITTDQFTD